MKVRVVPTEVFSRVVGYYRPIQNWHKGKVAEFNLRKTIDPLKTWRKWRRWRRKRRMDRLTTIFDICLYFTGCMMIGVVVVALALILREAYLTITKDKEEE